MYKEGNIVEFKGRHYVVLLAYNEKSLIGLLGPVAKSAVFAPNEQLKLVSAA
jgi:hypothetical protein